MSDTSAVVSEHRNGLFQKLDTQAHPVKKTWKSHIFLILFDIKIGNSIFKTVFYIKRNWEFPRFSFLQLLEFPF